MQLFENKDMGLSVKVVLDVNGNPWFKGKDVASALGYVNSRKAIADHVHPDDKKNWKELMSHETLRVTPSNSEDDSGSVELNGNEKTIVFISESGVYSLVMKSKKEEALVFQRWVTAEVLPSIRKTGSYLTTDQQYEMKNEYQLHCKVINYLMKFYREALIIPGLGENQVTSDMRIKSKMKGYRSGQPDIIIDNYHKKYRGLAIEMKTPTGKGKLSENQKLFLRDLELNGYKTLVSND